MENPPERGPKFTRKIDWLEFGVRDTRSGVVVWEKFVSLRDTLRRLAALVRGYH